MVKRKEKLVPLKRVAAQYIYDGEIRPDSHRFNVIVIPEEDKEYLIKNTSAFVFIIKRKTDWRVRVASESHIVDYQFDKEYTSDQIVYRTMKVLKDLLFESSVIVTLDSTIIETINGADEDEDVETMDWNQSRKKLHTQCVNAGLSAENTRAPWHKRHLDQMLRAGDKEIKNHRMEIYV